MKKLTASTIFIIVLLVLAMFVQGRQRFLVSVTGNVLMPADSAYRGVYGDTVFYPELKLGCKVVGDFYLWAGYGMVSASGETLELKLPADSSQHFISLGASYNGAISPRLEYLLDIGAFYVTYREETMGVVIDDSAVGLRAEGSLVFRIGRSLFAGLSLGYLHASDQVTGIAIKLGGFKGGVCLGVKL